ncbi:MAG: 7-carboxy-7-deazaguanine synthase QueE [Methanobacterium sp.]|nr:7-carboxy-7-deazaguanine synthase QueE [Methanobacterium sp.]
MKTYINEIFSSIQGEGMLLGRRQIFVRFSGCNLNCNYCDTPESRNPIFGRNTSVDELYSNVENLMTPDFHSISLTGGEPLLHADFIREFLKKIDYDVLIETNGSLPDELEKIVDHIEYASVDIKLPEHESISKWDSLIVHELKSINLLIEEGINTYCKLVVFPSTKVDIVGFIASKLVHEVKDTSELTLVIQPTSPLSNWEKNHHKLFEFSEKSGEYLDVLVIPQIHKLLKIR